MDETQLPIASDCDVVTARIQAKAIAKRSGFGGSDLTIIATAVAEIARNIVIFAGRGEILMSSLCEERRTGILIIAHDDGPGIDDVDLAMQGGYSTANSLGAGLCCARRLMDDFEITSAAGSGTTITMKKWLR